jgi:hypothetical protein
MLLEKKLAASAVREVTGHIPSSTSVIALTNETPPM